VAVVEVGMGGRYDSTNANNARVAVVTNVSLEHTQHLGATVAEIADHKAGVAKPGAILITAAQHPDARAAIATECARQGATLWRVTPGGDGEVRYSGEEAGLCIATPARTYSGLHLGLRGHHQHANAACAVAAVDALEALGLVRVAGDAVSRGLAAAYLPGRLEQLADDPVTLLDGAHNPDAAQALTAALYEAFQWDRLHLVMAMFGDKDVETVAGLIAPLADRAYVTVNSSPRSAPAERLASALRDGGVTEQERFPSVERAMGAARDAAGPEDLILVTGSFYTVADARPLFVNA
jgi:dihydrofolate synthase/folylpolyglutamate synthase